MGTRIDALYRKEGDTGWVGVSGGTGVVTYIRLADGFQLDADGTFKAEPDNLPTTSVNPHLPEHHFFAPDTSEWEDGDYLWEVALSKEGEPLVYLDGSASVAGGVEATPPPAPPVTASLCRCYLYLSAPDVPTDPQITLQLLGTPKGENTLDHPGDPVWDSGTGLWYCDIQRGAEVKVRCLSRPFSTRFVVPDEFTYNIVGGV